MKGVDGMEKLRQVVSADPYEFGYGPRVMKEVKVCRRCGSMEAANKYICSRCEERLPSQTIFQLYQKKHKMCKVCDTVLASYMRYCPHCGTEIDQ